MKESKQFISIFLALVALTIPSFGEEKSNKKSEKKSNKITNSLKGKLIELKGDKVTEGKISSSMDYYVLYHSASWWGGCKSVTKQLVSINKKNLKLGDKKKFQIVLVDYDRSEKGLEGYLKSSKMSWPAIKLDQKKSVSELTSLGETGFIPNIVLLKPDGTMVSNKRDVVLKKLSELAGS